MPIPTGEAQTPLTVIELLERAALSQQHGLRLLDRHERPEFYSWPAIRDRARCAAAAFLERGVQAGDRIVLILPTCVQFFDAFFGALYAGAVPVPLYPPVRLGRLNEYHRRTAAAIRTVGARA